MSHEAISCPDSPTEVWLPFTPHSITPSEKQRTRRILHSNSCFEHYVHALRQINMRLFAVDGDGNCLFRAVSHQLYGDDRHHGIVRRFCMDYMELQQSFFEPFIVGDMTAFQRYVRYKRQDAVWGDDPELQAICELYDRPAQVFAYDASAGAKRLRYQDELEVALALSTNGMDAYAIDAFDEEDAEMQRAIQMSMLQ
ncbi:hypothetical protein DYB32_007172 [Aphanomyces invadans]|uniref:ubiquitinyl hydrolase 1 n=1 Tax=Aphanomyces invadans TaxID=157072 RepID=A0A418APH7_9STRA|nr:hypothetical protein DYB32_007172 [Aphanomyces invadans]